MSLINGSLSLRVIDVNGHVCGVSTSAIARLDGQYMLGGGLIVEIGVVANGDFAGA